jgi:hypothetical protein
MVGRWRKRRPDHALGGDTCRADESRAGVGKMLVVIGALKSHGVFGDRIDNEEMSRHGAFLPNHE